MSSRRPDPPAALHPAVDRALTLLKTRGPQTAAVLGAALGVTGEAARQRLAKLAGDGLVAATAEPCGVGHCGCGLLLERLNSVESFDFHNYWGPRVGLEPIPLDWMHQAAGTLGYASLDDGLFLESIRIYDALMAAYGKDGFPEWEFVGTGR